ncbi:MAG TPA: 4Fe-4S binding protein [Tenuifilaceae bacterium]|nr:4Fe-4S binding protein [Tenuifilaceae bacterium]HPE17938.1 4Fe-4S binding protein [Tenuifilaceae bacterium]HPJ45389.1 4Fe-4S binding protein [Tenuifilaceae bacterium]HPQ33230.1 4Fe-4S binding protein [Tenuifilaceae bacterium]HRX67917.1 4Fe-4S binding protein [Tenuifilaceae bacterium]
MVNFGFSALEIASVDFDKTNRKLAEEIALLEPTFSTCISCGSCAGTCTASRFNGFSFRNMCHQIKLGNVTKAFVESEKCMLCGKCTLVCPRNVNTRNICRIVRKAANN